VLLAGALEDAVEDQEVLAAPTRLGAPLRGSTEWQ